MRQAPRRRLGIRVIAAVGLALGAAALLRLRAPQPPDNVFLVTLDTTRADYVGTHGRATSLTPTIDALAAQGVSFTEAHTPAPLTLPSHATMFTGLLPPEHGVRVNGRHALPASIPTLAEALQSHGYETAAFVGAFVLDRKFGLDRGFGIYDDAVPEASEAGRLTASRPGNDVLDAALAWLERYARRSGGDHGMIPSSAPPVFCWVHLYDAHQPYRVHAELGGTPFAGRATYDAQIAFLDSQVARLLDFVDAHGLRDRSVVIVVGDHGEGLGEHGESEHGYQLYEETLRVPLVLRAPRNRARAIRNDEMVSTVDLARTVLDLVGLPQTTVRGGRSLRDAIDGGAVGERPAYGETDLPFENFAWSPLRSLTTRHWKYVRTTKPELYDRDRDPKEVRNLFDSDRASARELEKSLADMEHDFQPQTAPEVVLPGVDAERLRALGYLAEGSPVTTAAGGTDLPDVKDMLPLKDREAELSAHITNCTITDEEIATAARPLVERSPGTAPFRQTLGSALLRLGQLDEAAIHLEEATRLRPDFAEAHSDLAQVYLRMRRESDADREIAVALRLKPNLPEALLGRGNLAALRNELDSAVADFQAALRERPTYAEAHLNLAHTFARKGQPEAAVAEYREAIRLRPEVRAAHEGMLETLLESGHVDEATVHARGLVKSLPADPWSHFVLGRLLVARGDVVAGLLELVEAERRAPNNADYVDAVARTLATSPDPRIGDRSSAVRLARRAAELAPRNPMVLDTLAAAYAAQGAFGDATRASREAIEVAKAHSRGDLVEQLEAHQDLFRSRRVLREQARIGKQPARPNS